MINKFFLTLILFSSFFIFSYEDELNQENNWRNKLDYLKKDLIEMKKWEPEEEVKHVIKNQIELREKQIKVVENILLGAKKNYNEAEIEVDLIYLEMDINYKIIESIKTDDQYLKNLLDQVISLNKKILSIKKEEALLNKKIEEIKKQNRIQELKKELEALE